ncbi:hypothetical protein [Dongia rigui]|uniref:Lipoprotein n=1 Tax=Dongia rigui TaxID=940149 RepID=A0ABU5DYV0_9PROT|nr:hypothetical protein [Dongia rigui]MDY0872511.1 hypothetical protein [Dongia rigui]
MRSFCWLPLAAVSLALNLAGCINIDTSFLPKTSSVVVKDVEIGANTWAAYQQYLAAISPAGQGVFAIASDGQGGESWVCKTASCADTSQFAANAIRRCEENNPGYTCVVFDIDRVPQIKFQPPH